MTTLKDIPKVDRILEWPHVKALLAEHPRPVVLRAVRHVLEQLRSEVARGAAGDSAVAPETLSVRIGRELTTAGAASLRRVINGTGVVMHTNLGRSPLPAAVREVLDDIAFGYSNLEFELETGERGSRHSHVERLIRELTGAEAALVVNNNAAAVLLALSALAGGREVVVSRGELVEIGGSFRIPDVMRQSGALLREVGATNRTHARDYQAAVTGETALLLKVHPSNFSVVGFTCEVTPAELTVIGREHGIPVMADVGSGSLVDLSPFLAQSEPTVQEFVAAGVDVITFSGDKLLGGPQAGIIVGKEQWLAPLRKHPLMRAVRMDKLTLAALEATLRLYRDHRQALSDIPTLRMLTLTAAQLQERGKKLLRSLRRVLPPRVRLSLVPGCSQAGGGALPLLELPTFLVAVDLEGVSAQKLEERLRKGNPPLLGRVWKDRFVFDLRTILDHDLPLLHVALRSLQD